jgi:membrane protease subunit (stomatin/prohibitin family)
MRIIDVIDHKNVMPDEFTHREPPEGSGDFRLGSQLIVSESQVAVFVRSGKALDALNAGRHTLSIANIPILADVLNLFTSGRTPFTAELYFINLRDMPQVQWGTDRPIPLETPGVGTGAALLRTNGTMSIVISDPKRFLMKFGVNRPQMRLADLKQTIQTKLLGDLTVLLMESGVKSIFDANRLLSDLEGGTFVKLSQQFEDEFGLRLNSFDAKPFDAKPASPDELMNYVSLETYERLRRLDIAETAAGNPGVGGAAAGAGLGFGVGQQIAGTMDPNLAQQQQQQQMMQQMMMQQMMKMMQGQEQPQQQAPQQQAAPASSGPATTREEIQAAIDQLDMRLMNGEISESIYNRLMEKWQNRLDALD